MSELSKSTIEAQLSSVQDRYLEKDIVSSKALKNIEIDGDKVSIRIELGYPAGSYRAELKQIVDGICDEDNALQMNYPMGDNFLCVEIPEETKGSADKLCQKTVLHLETFEAQHTLDPEFNLNNNQNLAQVFGKVQHFKKALKEFSFLQDKEIVELRFSE